MGKFCGSGASFGSLFLRPVDGGAGFWTDLIKFIGVGAERMACSGGLGSSRALEDDPGAVARLSNESLSPTFRGRCRRFSAGGEAGTICCL